MATEFFRDLVGEPAKAILDNLSKLGDKYIVLEQLIPKVNELLTDQAKEMRQLNKELGTGSRTSAELRQSFAKLSREIGVATDKVFELVSQTREYHQGIQETTSSTLKFLKASGASSDIVAKFSAKLNILGKASDASFTSMYESILSVRDAYGLTDSQIDNIITSLESYAVVTGASNEQMEKASVTLAKFTSQLTSAGMAADDVSEIINGMLDPDKMTDNLALMSKLGVSISDMVSGDPIAALDGAADRLKKLSQEIVSISKTNRLQANEVAKVYGLTLEQASTLANMDTSENALNTQKKLEQYRQEMTTFTESIGNTINVLSGIVSGPLLAVGKMVEGFGNTLGMLPRGISALLVAFTGKKILNIIVERLGEAAKGFGRNAGEAMSQYLSQVDKRSENKKRDISALSPKFTKNDISYGFGWNYLVKAEKRAASLATLKADSTSITGEMVENMQSMWNQIKELKKYGDSLSKTSSERQAFNAKYGEGIEKFTDSFGAFFGKIESAQNKGNEWGTTFYSDFEKLRQKDAKTKFANQLRNNLSNVGINLDNLGFTNDENQQDKIMKLANQSKGPKEFLEKLSEFYMTVEKTPEVDEYIKNTSIALDNLNSSAEAAVGSVEKYNDTIIAGAKVLDGKEANKGFKGRFSKFFQGLAQNIATLFKSISPKKMIVGGLGGVSALIGTKLISSLSKNEKFQESMSKITEKFSIMFDGLITSIEPAITSIAGTLSSFLDFINPAVEWLANWLGKGASWLSGKLNKTISNISDSVATIEDSYKQEDLKTMVAASGVYDSDNDALIAVMNKVIYKLDNITKNQEVGNDTRVLSMA